MWVLRVVTMLGLAGALSGCAMGRSRQEFSRLQSQVGLLDERVTQLERSVGATSASSWNAAPASAVVADATAMGQEPRPSAARTADARSSLKPSTREIQQALKNAGFYQGNIDGKMGPMTRDAVREFQRIHGLKDDGVVGKQTWVKLSTYAQLSSNSGEASAAEVLK